VLVSNPRNIEFEVKVKEILKKQKIIPESENPTGIKLIYALEDFFEKNKEQFIKLENSNRKLNVRLEEMSATK